MNNVKISSDKDKKTDGVLQNKKIYQRKSKHASRAWNASKDKYKEERERCEEIESLDV